MVRGFASLLSHVLFDLIALASNALRRVVFGRHPYDWVEIVLKGEVSEERPLVGLLASFTRPRLALKDLTEIVRLAREDGRVKGILLRIDGLEAGWAKIQSIRESLERARRAGKRTIAFLETAGNAEYLLASACERVFLVPTGSVSLTGLHAEVLLLKDALAKLDVEADFESVGRYKGAAEAFTRSSLSEPQREVLNSILDDLYGQLVEGISAGRGRPPEEVRAWIDEGPHLAREALGRGLVDRLLYSDEIEAAIEDLEEGTEPAGEAADSSRAQGGAVTAASGGGDGPNAGAPSAQPARGVGAEGKPEGNGDATEPSTGADDAGDGDEDGGEDAPADRRIRIVDVRHYLVRRHLPYRPLTTRPARELIGIVPLSGIIKSGESTGATPMGRTLGSDTAVTILRRARENARIRAVVLRIDSPGGSGLASDVIWREIALTSAEKPVVASLSDEAASGGYYIASAATAIVSAPGTLTGSIGVIGGKMNLKGLYHKAGARKEAFSRGRRAGFFTEYGGFTEEERAKLRSELAAFYDDFVDRVARGRHRAREQVLDVAEGRVWTGRQALSIGLVDDLGGLERAVEVAREKAEIPPDRKVGLVMYPRLGHLVRLSLDFGPPGGGEAWFPAAAAGRLVSRFPAIADLAWVAALPVLGVRLLALAPWRARIR